jgi:hypothetical protein
MTGVSTRFACFPCGNPQTLFRRILKYTHLSLSLIMSYKQVTAQKLRRFLHGPELSPSILQYTKKNYSVSAPHLQVVFVENPKPLLYKQVTAQDLRWFLHGPAPPETLRLSQIRASSLQVGPHQRPPRGVNPKPFFLYKQVSAQELRRFLHGPAPPETARNDMTFLRVNLQ